MSGCALGQRLAFVTGRRVAFHGGTLQADPGLGRVIDLLSTRFPRFTLLAPTAPMSPLLSHTLRIGPNSHQALPTMSSILAGHRYSLSVRKVLRSLRGQVDATIVQLAFPATPALWAIDTPTVFHVYGDPLALARDAGKYRGLSWLPALAAASYLDRMQRRLVRQPGARVVANGDVMLQRYGSDRGRAVVSSTLFAHEVASVARSRPTDGPFRILFAGYLRPEKGVDTLLDAYGLVLRRLPEAELHLVGPGDLSSLGPKVQLTARELGARGRIVRHGALPFGPDLFQSYADADVLALPTRSEGTPRVLVEARAFGCPVISTPVGGVTSSVCNGHDGILVPPNDPCALADEILAIQADELLRERLRANGFARARATTVEAFADALAAEVEIALGTLVTDRS